MRLRNYFISTTKETPADAEIVSHQLMLRSGMIRKVAAGIYTWLPIGLKVLRKVETIVREEMDRSGAIEVLMPAIQPSELWQETGRWDLYGPLLLRMKDANDRDFCFGPTHEEVITDWTRKELRSYKQLPVTFYQIQTKFRDEIRPRFGVMRSREFVMKDGYSFDIDVAAMGKTYDVMYQTYSNIFNRLGLKYRAVLADSGEIGGNMSHEFHVLADSGEDLLAYSDGSEYAANIERAEALQDDSPRPAPGAPMEKISTPNCQSIADVGALLKKPDTQLMKSILVKDAADKLFAIMLRGDHEINPIKLCKHPEITAPIDFANETDVKNLNSVPGFIGPIDLNVKIIADLATKNMANFVCGANQTDQHYQHVNWGRDLPEPEFFDCRNVVAGDPSPDGQGQLKICRGIEVGHIFQLGTKYSEAMKATVLDKDGKQVNPQMGCYGIGVSRIVASAIEQNHDENGIIWPDAIAPFHLSLIPINMSKSKRLQDAAECLYQQLMEAGFEVLFDDRNERPGKQFADSELLGIPHRLVLSEKSLDQNEIEYKSRRGDTEQIPIAKLIEELSARIKP